MIHVILIWILCLCVIKFWEEFWLELKWKNLDGLEECLTTLGKSTLPHFKTKSRFRMAAGKSRQERYIPGMSSICFCFVPSLPAMTWLSSLGFPGQYFGQSSSLSEFL